MNDRAARLFASPMPFKIQWLIDGRFASITSYSRDIADQLFAEQVEKGNDPVLYLGGMVISGTEGPELAASRRIAEQETKAIAKATSPSTPTQPPRFRPKLRSGSAPPSTRVSSGTPTKSNFTDLSAAERNRKHIHKVRTGEL